MKEQIITDDSFLARIESAANFSRMIGPILVFGAITAYFAHKRGYNWLCWFLACGLIGMIVVILMPSAKKEGLNEDEKAKIIKRGNLVGTIMTAVWILLMVALYFLVYAAKAHQR